MSFGKMNQQLMFFDKSFTTTPAGFQEGFYRLVRVVRGYREGRHGNAAWANRAAFTKSTDLFRIRAIPDLKLDESMLILHGGQWFEIDSIEDIRGQGRYLEILATATTPEGE